MIRMTISLKTGLITPIQVNLYNWVGDRVVRRRARVRVRVRVRFRVVG